VLHRQFSNAQMRIDVLRIFEDHLAIFVDSLLILPVLHSGFRTAVFRNDLKIVVTGHVQRVPNSFANALKKRPTKESEQHQTVEYGEHYPDPSIHRCYMPDGKNKAQQEKPQDQRNRNPNHQTDPSFEFHRQPPFRADGTTVARFPS
jgi:hypothetical protein